MAAAPIQQNGTHTGVPIDLDPPDSRKRPLEAPPEAGSTKRTNTGGGYCFHLPAGPIPRRPPCFPPSRGPPSLPRPGHLQPGPGGSRAPSPAPAPSLAVPDTFPFLCLSFIKMATSFSE
ncbi:Hypothetical predicted protein [Marmota monax]|uniref:Uncharacterized protein n=1 Tax=Marmota monax TaxID=9995 RepID=A0A5E4AY38_MARMO|nr:hypothetical protein GHT09_007477 [Marmota monax]VTJ61740.1 Hypothetical predicted protein [Marmota monax]